MNKHFIFGVVYRSPNSTDQCCVKLNELITTITDEHSIPKENLFIVGDFNYPEIDWSTETCAKDFNSEPSKFLTTSQECFLTQHVDKPTHYRALQTPSLLDLILSNNPDLLHNIIYYPPFGKSHHLVICFSLNISPSPPIININAQTSKHQINKGRYDDMREYLSDVDWDKILMMKMLMLTHFGKI